MTKNCNFCLTPLTPTGKPVECPTCGAKYVPVKVTDRPC